MNKKPDAGFGLPQSSGTAAVLRSMEAASYYAENNIDMARRWVSTKVVAFASYSILSLSTANSLDFQTLDFLFGWHKSSYSVNIFMHKKPVNFVASLIILSSY